MWLIFTPSFGPLLNFYSHIPCGMWPTTELCFSTFFSFLLTHPVWDVTRIVCTGSPVIPSFLLTHPVWDVTTVLYRSNVTIMHFYSHIPCGMWRKCHRRHWSLFFISTHTSRVGCDIIRLCFALLHCRFLLTHPVWDVTHNRIIQIRNWFPFLLTHPVWDVTNIDGCY